MIQIKIFDSLEGSEKEINKFLLESGGFLVDRPFFSERVIAFTYDPEIKEPETKKEKTREQIEAEGILDGMSQEVIKLKIQRETLQAEVTVQNMDNIAEGREMNHVQNEQRKSAIKNIDQRLKVMEEMKERYQKIADGKENEEDNSGKNK